MCHQQQAHACAADRVRQALISRCRQQQLEGRQQPRRRRAAAAVRAAALAQRREQLQRANQAERELGAAADPGRGVVMAARGVGGLDQCLRAVLRLQHTQGRGHLAHGGRRDPEQPHGTRQLRAPASAAVNGTVGDGWRVVVGGRAPADADGVAPVWVCAVRIVLKAQRDEQPICVLLHHAGHRRLVRAQPEPAATTAAAAAAAAAAMGGACRIACRCRCC